MAQIGNVHPDSLVPYWHAARQLTPEEAEIVGRITVVRAPEHITDRERDLVWWLEDLPQIPPRRADRVRWSLALTSDDSMRWYSYEGERKHLNALKAALREHDLRMLLRLMTERRPLEPKHPSHDTRPEWQKQLQAIRDSLEKRIDDALEQAAQAKAAETQS